MQRATRQLLGWLLAIFGSLGFLISLNSLFDPAGAKMADDGDPFGKPDPWYMAAAISATYLAAALLGFWLAQKGPRSGKGAV